MLHEQNQNINKEKNFFLILEPNTKTGMQNTLEFSSRLEAEESANGKQVIRNYSV